MLLGKCKRDEREAVRWENKRWWNRLWESSGKLLWQFQIKNFIKALHDCGKVLRINCRSLSAKPLSDKGFWLQIKFLNAKDFFSRRNGSVLFKCKNGFKRTVGSFLLCIKTIGLQSFWFLCSKENKKSRYIKMSYVCDTVMLL